LSSDAYFKWQFANYGRPTAAHGEPDEPIAAGQTITASHVQLIQDRDTLNIFWRYVARF